MEPHKAYPLCKQQAPRTTCGHHTATIQESKGSLLLDSDSETTAQHIALLEKAGCEMREQGCFHVVQLGEAGQAWAAKHPCKPISHFPCQGPTSLPL